MRLENSLCDIVRLKSDQNIYEIDGVTPKSQEWKDKVFPYRYLALYCHENPNDAVGRKVFCYCDVKKSVDTIGEHELDITNFNITPKKLYNLFEEHNYMENICVVDLDNLDYVLPNVVKRDKILNDGNTYCLITDLDQEIYPESTRSSLVDYNYKNRSGETVVLSTWGKVVGVQTDEYYPIQVEFPNGYKGGFVVSDLTFAHEV